MKRELVDFLVCPACLPAEHVLSCRVDIAAKDDVLRGMLTCPSCGKCYPVEDGTANLLVKVSPNGFEPAAKYEDSRVLASYLWSHYGDLLEDPEHTDAYSRWGEQLAEDKEGLALDAGCAVGRFTFQLGGQNRLAVGIDSSETFVRLARRLACEGKLSFSLPLEGNLSTRKTILLPRAWRNRAVEFIIADATALPFPKSLFTTVTSLNVVDKVPEPLIHLKELNRVARRSGAQLLFSDPFSWSSEYAPENRWLGGASEGRYTGFGKDNVRRLLLGDGDILAPCWRISSSGAVRWKIRSHRNHYELITSEYLVAMR